MRVAPLICLLLLAATARAADPDKGEALLQLEAGGPTARVTALAFGKDGSTIHAGGLDKVVRTWHYKDKKFVRSEGQNYRIPIGPGSQGAINSLAVSADDTWLAVAGDGVVRESAGFRQHGIVLPATGRLDEEMLKDRGVIHVFRRNDPSKVKALRGHRGVVLGLAFVQGEGHANHLASYAMEFDGKTSHAIVRLWDVESGTEVKGVNGHEVFELLGERPGLTAVAHGKGERDVLVAVAVQSTEKKLSSNLSVWDVAEDKVRTVLTGAYADTVVAPSPDQLVIGGLGRQGGTLNAWKIAPGKDPQAAADISSDLGVNLVPRALALASSKPGGKADLVAVALRQGNNDINKEAFRLQLRDFTGGLKADVLLWTGGRILPVLASTPGGRFVAVAGNLAHDIHVYDVAALVGDQRDPGLQKLSGSGKTWQSVAFVTKGKSTGLLLSSDPGSRPKDGAAPALPAQDAVVFDLTTGKVSKDVQGWALDSAAAVPDLKPPGVNDTERRTTWATYKGGDFAEPILAHAFQERGQTYLFLRTGKENDPVRLLTGHVNPVTALAFSKDGRLLASVAEDQTVCVWSLTDLKGTIGKQGLIRGLVVRGDGGKVTVTDLDASALSAANKKALDDAGVRTGTAVEAIIEKGNARVLKDMREFYEAAWMTRPTTNMTVQFGGKEVVLRADQGTDERKPLFTVFLTAEGQWVGWNPQGPYDRSSDEAETWIGWQKNTGQPDHPVTFAGAKDYRDEFYRRGLLERLIDRAELGAAMRDLKPKEVPDPVVRAELLEKGKAPVRRDAGGVTIVQKRPLELVVKVDNVTAKQIDAVRWRADQGKWHTFVPAGDTEFREDVSDEPWQRGAHTIEIDLRTTDGVGRQRPLQFSYRPAAPQLNFPDAWLKQFDDTRSVSVRKQEFPIASTAEPVKGHKAKTVLLLNGKMIKESADGKIDLQNIELQKGRNEVVVRAVNDGADEVEGTETTLQTFTVEYSPVALPRLVVESVTPSSTGGILPRESEAVVVNQQEVRIRGLIDAETELASATFDGTPMPNFKAGAMKKWAFDIPYKLKPGEQTLTLKAQAKDSAETTWKLKIEFVPELPVFFIRKPGDLDAIPAGTKEIVLEVSISPPADEGYKFEVFDGKTAHEIEMKPGAKVFTRTVSVEPGENKLELRVKYKDRSRPRPVRAYVLRPPEVATLTPPARPENAVIALTAEVETAADLDLTSARLTGPGGDRKIDLDKEVKRGEPDKGVRRWTIKLPDVALTEDVENEFVLRVANRDGEVSKAVKIQGPKPKPKDAVVAILDPKRDITVEQDNYAVRVSVSSETDLTRLAVLRDGEEVAQLPHRDRITEQTVKVPLKAGPNVIEVVAVNARGATHSKKRTISRRADTVFLNVETLAPRVGEGKEVKATRKADKLVVDEVEGGEMVLKGRVRWLDRRAEVYQPQLIRVWVNDFEQFPASLEKADDNLERTFRVAVRLNQEKNNRIVLSLPGLKIDQTTPAELTVDRCTKPEKEQRLHLLIVGVGLKDSDQSKLVGNVLETFQARNIKEGNARNLVVKEFQTPVFKEGRVYGPLAGDATKQEVYAMLEHISDTVRAEQGQMNEVLVVYFEGEREVTSSDYYLMTQQAQLLKNPQRAALTRDGLRAAIGKTLGAQLLLLDVKQKEKGAQPEAPTDFQRMGMFEYTWLKDNPPENGRLLDSLKESMTQARLLNEVKDQVSVRGARLSAKDKEFLYDIRVSDVLGRMAVGSGN